MRTNHCEHCVVAGYALVENIVPVIAKRNLLNGHENVSFYSATL